MADVPSEKTHAERSKETFNEILGILIAIFFLAYFLNGFVNAINQSNLLKNGWRGLTPSGIWKSLSVPVSSVPNPINSKFVVVSNTAPLYKDPGGRSFTTKKVGDKGVIIGGLVTSGGTKYWNVKFENGDSGWMNENDIGVLPAKYVPLSSLPSLIGSSVETKSDAIILDQSLSNEIGKEKTASFGTIVEGPQVKNGYKYWHIKFQDGKDGWVREDFLNSINTEKIPLSTVGSPKGGKVSVSLGPLAVFEKPGQNQVALESTNAGGTVLAGPENYNGTNYYQIKFDDGVTGWAGENNLNYINVNSTSLGGAGVDYVGKDVSISKNGTEIYDKPAGQVISTKDEKAPGKIVEGPLIVNGIRYWHIKFEDGTDGWVSENNLDYVQNVEPNFFLKGILFFWKLLSFAKPLAVIFTVIFIIGIIYFYRKLSEMRRNERKLLYPVELKFVPVINEKWERVQNLVNSGNDSDWKLAIIEADTMLDEILAKLELPGSTTGDKLKAVEKSDFVTIDNAWEAHKIRNQIAHEGGTFLISQREAKRVIALYKTVFDEFKII
jgi:hypothetical protein